MQWLEYADHWRSFNMDAYSACSAQMLSTMGAEFAENRSGLGLQLGQGLGSATASLSVAMDVVRLIDLIAIARSAPDLTAAEQFLLDHLQGVADKAPSVVERALLGAHCWAVKNQGRVRKARQLLESELKTSFSAGWADLLQQTENFTKGSLLALTSESSQAPPSPAKSPGKGDKQTIEVDRFAGFRQRLLRKYGWLYGYLAERQGHLRAELQKLELDDPINKVLHRVRPSQLQKVQRAREDAFLLQRSQLDSALAEVLSHMSSWQSYFGPPQILEKMDPWKANREKDSKKGKDKDKEKGPKAAAPKLDTRGEAAVRQMANVLKDAKGGKDSKSKAKKK